MENGKRKIRNFEFACGFDSCFPLCALRLCGKFPFNNFDSKVFHSVGGKVCGKLAFDKPKCLFSNDF